jgi:hypothetical protein
MPESDYEREQEDAAAAEAARIGGEVSSEPPSVDADERDPADQPVSEAGGGEAEGFEEAERELIEHASHGDEHAAGRVLQDAPDEVDDPRAARAGEADAAENPDA